MAVESGATVVAIVDKNDAVRVWASVRRVVMATVAALKFEKDWLLDFEIHKKGVTT
jgi:hypothetical protein